MDKTVSIIPAKLLVIVGICLFSATALVGCGGCSAQHERPAFKQEAPASDAASQTIRQAVSPSSFRSQERLLSGIEVRPVARELSPSAKASAAYLSLLDAMANGNEEAAIAAGDELVKGTGDNVLPESQWLEGALWFVERKSVNVIPFLKNATTACPDNVPLLLVYAEALNDHNFGKEALDALSAFLIRNPGNVEILLQIGITQLRSKNTAEALSTFASIREGRTGLVDYYHARALLSQGKQEEALKYLKSAVRLLPDFGDAHAELAYLHERMGNYREARQAYEKLLHMNFPRKELILRLINLSLKVRQPAQALTYYRQGPADDMSYHLSAAALFCEERHYLQAESILKVLASRPDAPSEVYLFLADLTYEQRHDLNSALKWLTYIPEKGPYAQRRLLLTAQIQAEDGKTDEALATVHRGRELFPTSPDFVNMEARILTRAKHLDKAIQTAREGLSRWPDSVEIAFLLGNLMADKGQKEEAFQIMESILTKQPDNYQALNYVGYTLAEENRDLPRAIELLTRANALAPKQFFILDSLAWAHFRAGHDDEAWAFIREAARLDPGVDPAIQEHYGDIATKKGLKNEARKAYRRALNKNPANAESIRKRMEAL